MRTLPTVGAFKMHLALMTLVGLWLTITEYVLEVPFVVTVVVVAALVLISGLVTSTRVSRLANYSRRELQVAQYAARKAEEDLRLVIGMLPSLRAMYDELCLLMAPTTYVMYEFSRWLDWALDPQHTNIMEWLHTCHTSKGTALPELHGVCDELDGAARRKKEGVVAYAAYGAYMDTEIFRSTQTQPDGSGEQKHAAPSEPERSLKTA